MFYVNMTNRCPCACTFCLRQNAPGVYGSDPLWLDREPTVEEVEQSLSKCDLSSMDEVVFCGYGEPAERLKDLLEVAAWLKKNYTVKTRINTNGLADLIWVCQGSAQPDQRPDHPPAGGGFLPAPAPAGQLLPHCHEWCGFG